MNWKVIRRRRRGWGMTAVVATVASVTSAGCESLTSVNNRLNDPHVALERRLTNSTRAATVVATAPLTAEGSARVRPTRSGPVGETPPPLDGADVKPDGVFVGLALSGGGSRSANFSAACMFQLERVGLLQDVDYISSVSGGSLTGAYYCVAEDQYWNPGTVQKRLTRSFATDVIVQSLIPWNTLTLWFT